MTHQFRPADLAALFDAFDRLEQGSNVLLSQSENIESAPQDSGDGPFVGLYSSGSTGRPKLVWRRWNRIKSELRLSPEVSHWVWASPFSPASFAGFQVAAQAWKAGGSILSLGKDWNANWELLTHSKVDALSCTPTFLDLMLQAIGVEIPHAGFSQISLGG